MRTVMAMVVIMGSGRVMESGKFVNQNTEYSLLAAVEAGVELAQP